MFKQETIDAMWEHYSHAKEKHPFFADRVMTPWMLPEYKELTKEQNKHARDWNKSCVRYWNRKARFVKSYINRMPSAENVLEAEVCEIYAAVAKGDLKQAHYEIFDAIAVLLRLDEEMEKILEVEVEK